MLVKCLAARVTLTVPMAIPLVSPYVPSLSWSVVCKVCQQPHPAVNTALCYKIPKPFDSEWNPGQLSPQDLSVRFKISVMQLQTHNKERRSVDGYDAYLLIVVVDTPKGLMPNKEC